MFPFELCSFSPVVLLAISTLIGVYGASSLCFRVTALPLVMPLWPVLSSLLPRCGRLQRLCLSAERDSFQCPIKLLEFPSNTGALCPIKIMFTICTFSGACRSSDCFLYACQVLFRSSEVSWSLLKILYYIQALLFRNLFLKPFQNVPSIILQWGKIPTVWIPGWLCQRNCSSQVGVYIRIFLVETLGLFICLIYNQLSLMYG